MTTAPDDSTRELASRLGANAEVCTVVATRSLSESLHEVVLSGPRALAGVPGNDVMVRVINPAGKYVRRRYSVREVDPERERCTLWITVAHDGPGSRWAKNALPGDEVDVIGPRGKIVLDPHADWYLFAGDVSALAASYRMAQSIETPGRAVFIIEIDSPSDALTADFDERLSVTGIFVDRQGRDRGDPTGLLNGLAALTLPPDDGHAYLLGEFHVVKALKAALIDRGLDETQIMMKAFWRTGRGNADHGEPDKSID